jgi:hypothetical protein
MRRLDDRAMQRNKQEILGYLAGNICPASQHMLDVLKFSTADKFAVVDSRFAEQFGPGAVHRGRDSWSDN